jgi:uncharacterized protein YndB with AHSA1/START domain
MTEKSLELSINRYIDAPPATVYRVWTERTAEWFAPKPFKTRVIAQELKPGGRSEIEMEGPDGTTYPEQGVFLEVVPNERVVTTNLFAAGWEPRTTKASECDMAMVAITTFEPEGEGTRYTARARHFDAEAVKAHQEMGFEQGWGMVADQLAELAEAEAAAERQAA